MAKREQGIARLAGLCVGFALLAFAATPAGASPGWVDSFAVDPSAYHVAMGPDGTTVYAAQPTVNGKLRAAVQVRPPGGPVGDLQMLSTPDATGVSIPAVAAGPDGRFVAAWTENGMLQTAVLMPGSTTFGDVKPMPPTGDQPQSNILVAVDKTGDAFLVWPGFLSTGSGPQLFLRFGARPASGDPPIPVILDQTTPNINVNSNLYPSGLAVSDAGAAIVGWSLTTMQFTPFTMSTSTSKAAIRPAAGTFGSTITLDSGMDNGGGSMTIADSPAVAMNAAGDLAATWSFRTSGGGPSTSQVRYRAGTAAGGLSATVENPAASGGSMPVFPLVAMAPDGRAAVAYNAQVGGVQKAQVAFRSVGGGFALTQTIPTPDPSSYLNIAGGASGGFVLALSTYTGGKSKIYGAFSPPDRFFDPPKLLDSDLSSAYSPEAGIAAAGDGVVSWRALHTGGATYETHAAGYDVSGPQLTGLQIPATGTAGAPVAFSVTPVDIWSPIASIAWTFGDGGTDSTAAPSHTYADAGDRTVGVTATDALGNSSSTTGPISIAPAPPPPAQPATDVAPVVTGFALTNKTFAVGPKPTALVARRKPPRGTTFKYALSEDAAVAITIARQVPGLRKAKGKPCLVATTKLRRALAKKVGARGLRRLACVAYKRAGVLKRSGKAGANSVAFSGRLGRRALARGRYRATLVATDPGGYASKPVAAGFRIVKR